MTCGPRFSFVFYYATFLFLCIVLCNLSLYVGSPYKRSIKLFGYYLSQHIELIDVTFMYIILLQNCWLVRSCWRHCCRQSYDVEINVSVPGTTMKSCNVLDLKNPFFRYTGQQPQPPPGNNHASPTEAYWNQHDLTAGNSLTVLAVWLQYTANHHTALCYIFTSSARQLLFLVIVSQSVCVHSQILQLQTAGQLGVAYLEVRAADRLEILIAINHTINIFSRD